MDGGAQTESRGQTIAVIHFIGTFRERSAFLTEMLILICSSVSNIVSIVFWFIVIMHFLKHIDSISGKKNHQNKDTTVLPSKPPPTKRLTILCPLIWRPLSLENQFGF